MSFNSANGCTLLYARTSISTLTSQIRLHTGPVCVQHWLHLSISHAGEWTNSIPHLHLSQSSAPDMGPRLVPARSGIVAIGATEWITNYNILIDSQDLKIVRQISARVSQRGGGLKGVEAMALRHEQGEMLFAAALTSAPQRFSECKDFYRNYCFVAWVSTSELCVVSGAICSPILCSLIALFSPNVVGVEVACNLLGSPEPLQEAVLAMVSEQCKARKLRLIDDYIIGKSAAEYAHQASEMLQSL